MDVRGAKAPQAVPSPGRTPLSRPRPAAPGLARAGGRASCLPPTLASRPVHPAPALRRLTLPGQQILSDADASLPGIAGPRLPSPGLACTRPASPGPARPRPGWRTRVLPAPDIGILTRTLPQAAPSPGRTPPVRPQDNPGTRTPGLRPASPGLARPRPGSPALARAGGRASCLSPTLASRPAHSLKMDQRPAARRPPGPHVPRDG